MASCQVALSGRLQEKREPRLKKNNEAKMSLMSCIDWYIRSASHKRMEPKAKAKGINQRGRVETKPFDPHTKSLDWIYSNFFVGEGGSEMKNPFASFSLTWSLCHLSEGPGEQSAAAAAGGNIRSISTTWRIRPQMELWGSLKGFILLFLQGKNWMNGLGSRCQIKASSCVAKWSCEDEKVDARWFSNCLIKSQWASAFPSDLIQQFSLISTDALERRWLSSKRTIFRQTWFNDVWLALEML